MKLVSLFLTLTLWGQTIWSAPLINADVSGILSSGTTTPHGPSVTFEKGLYEAGPMDSSATHFILVDDYVNDPNKKIVLMFPKNLDRTKTGRAQIFQARPIKSGRSIMLAPIVIDQSGNLRITSEMQTDAPVVLVSQRTGKKSHFFSDRYSMMLTGKNGALSGQLWGMEKKDSKRPSLKDWPSNDIFVASYSDKEPTLAVRDGEVSIFNTSIYDQTYNLSPLNGDSGKFASLSESKFDTMGEYDISSEQISQLATFVRNCWNREVMLILKPTNNWVYFQIHFYQMVKPNVLEQLLDDFYYIMFGIKD